jgi:Right handed beta helix region
VWRDPLGTLSVETSSKTHSWLCFILGLGLWLSGTVSVWPQTTYTVDASVGNDAHPGTAALPFRSIAKAALAAVHPGDNVLVKPGVYPEPVIIAGAGTSQHPVIFRSEIPGAAIITGHIQPQGWPGDHAMGAGATQNHDITWRGFAVAGGQSYFQLRAAEGWHIDRMTFGGGQNGINIRAHRVIVENSTFRDLIGHAVVAVGGHHIIIRHNHIHRINTAGIYNPANSAVTKFLQTNGLLIEKNLSEDNVGPGFWLDWENTNYTIRYNVVKNNKGKTAAWQGPGIWTEINPGPGLIEYNTISGNSGAGIGVLESPRVTVQKNTITGGYACIELRNLDRGSAGLHIHSATLRHNTCTNAGAGIVSSIGNWKGFDMKASNVVIDQNTYSLPSQRPVVSWLGTRTFTRAETCAKLGLECMP